MARPIIGRTFSYRAGVRVRDSVLACDATAGGDLIFLSHAGALEGAAAQRLPSPRGGRRKILATEVTLALAGPSGQRLRPYTLVAAYGRPFNLGELRLELFPSGSGEGAASLLCEREAGRLVYSGPVGSVAPGVRVADALCLDGTYGSARFVFPSPEEALARILDFVHRGLAAGRAPVLLAHPRGPLVAIAAELDRAGIPLRAHRSVMAAAATYRSAGVSVPALARFAGTLARGEALLWPPEARDAALLNRLATPIFLLASGAAADPAVVTSMRVDAAVPLSTMADFAGLLRYVDATGPREVAVVRAGDGELCHALRLRGIDAYAVGPPEQISLF